MILSVSYNFYNGEEHLVKSIESIRNNVEHISIVYQEISNRGEKCSKQAEEVMSKIIENKLVDEVYFYNPDLSLQPQHNEIKKRIIGLEIAKKAKATHFFTMDSDEFYRNEEFKNARQKIIEEKITSSSVNSFLHVRRPIYRGKDNTKVAFITEIQNLIKLGSHNYPVAQVDPTRQIWIPKRNHYHFLESEISMYHMNLVRKDLRQKLNNSSTTNKNFLDLVYRSVNEWKEDDKFFEFPRKGKIKIEISDNEFNTYDPEIKEKNENLNRTKSPTHNWRI